MSFIKRWDADNIISNLRACTLQAGCAHNDGFTAWACKKDLLQVKYELERMLRDLPTFAGEDEYCKEQEKQDVWRTLKNH